MSTQSLTLPFVSRSQWLCFASWHPIDSRPFRSMAIAWASHSRDTIWPWKFKVKGTPVSTAFSSLISLVFHNRTSYQLLSLLLHDNRTSDSRDTIWPWKFKVKGQGQRYPSQHCVQLTHLLSVSHQGIPSTPVPLVPWLSGLPFPRYSLNFKIQGQRCPSQPSIKLTHFLFVTHQLDQPFLRYGKYNVQKPIWNLWNISLKDVSDKI